MERMGPDGGKAAVLNPPVQFCRATKEAFTESSTNDSLQCHQFTELPAAVPSFLFSFPPEDLPKSPEPPSIETELVAFNPREV